MADDTLAISVAYCSPTQSLEIALSIARDSTVADAIQQSGILRRFPEIDINHNKVGVFSSLCSLDKLLQNGDRVEIYRPLQQDPMTARRNRSQSSKPA
jgi:putative ubiquitin-RnfH superfamily antitoxin RatB of RatAB toxin-antitoxin module